jgi:shikimate dehydrogenase
VALSRPSFAVIGDPVEHSLSPRIFAQLFADLGIEGHYTALRVGRQELPSLLEQVRRGTLAGVSVTLPHKESILPLLDDLHPTARRIGAVNCVGRQPDGRLVGFNTDAMGFRRALEQRDVPLAAARVVLLGAGGAARAAAFAAVSAGAKSLAIANRAPTRALTLAQDLCEAGWAWPEGEVRRALAARGWRLPQAAGPSGRAYVVSIPLEQAPLQQALTHADVVVNATSVGLGDGGASPLPAGLSLPQRIAAMDMVYRPLQTAFLQQAREAGARQVDGLWMLVHQAIEQLRIWTGCPIPAALATKLHDGLAQGFHLEQTT